MSKTNNEASGTSQAAWDADQNLPLYDVSRPPSRLTGPRRLPDPVPLAAHPLFVVQTNKMAYGPAVGQKTEWNQLGANNEERFAAYIDQQLDPDSIDDSEFENLRAAANYQTLDLHLNKLWIDYERDQAGATDSDDPQDECEREWFLRAVHSKKQLEQRMTEFWVDHFNINSEESPTDSLWPHWVQTLRKHVPFPGASGVPADPPSWEPTSAMGNFHKLLFATAHHPAMLYYLDQYTSTVSGPNENYCREMIELHTFGAENYLGVNSQASVGNTKWASKWDNSDPVITSLYPSGFPDGYVDNDIFGSAVSFAGWTLEFGDNPGTAGRYFFNAASNLNTLSSSVLAFGFNNVTNTIPMAERGEHILRMLAYHPATAQHIAGKLVRKFVSDNPSQTLIDSAADVFWDNRYEDDQIALVLRHIFESTEFRNSFGQKMKRPFDVFASMLRAMGGELDWSLGNSLTGFVIGEFARAGHRPFRWVSPDGYPDHREKWENAAPRVMTWRMALYLSRIDDDNDELVLRMDDLTPGSVARTPAALADHWIDRFFPQDVSAEFREIVTDYMAQGFNPDFEIAITPGSTTETRFQMLMSLLAATPEFCER